MTTKDKEKSDINNIIYDYTTNVSLVEEENRVLRETINTLRSELDRFKQTPLMLCELRDIIGDKAIIRIPNGNSFMVNISKECTNLKPGDTVLTDQKNLTVLEKIGTQRRFNVERFVIVEKP